MMKNQRDIKKDLSKSTNETLLKNFLQSKRIQFFEFEKLASHTSVQIGGMARFFVYVKTIKCFAELVDFLETYNIKYCVLGNGTNTLASDNGFDGVIICTNKLRRTRMSKTGIYVQCGLGLFEFCRILQNKCLAGLEFLYGIPGTVGGAIVMNAGAYGGDIGDFVQYVKAYKNGKVVKLSKQKLNFGYRSSVFQNSKMIVLGAKFVLKTSDMETIFKLQKDNFQKKISLQPYDHPSFGSAFKKCKGLAVSKLIDELGLKGFTIGGAQISTKHAGFIINLGGATCKDFYKMIKYIQMRVKDAYGILPEPEVKLLE